MATEPGRHMAAEIAASAGVFVSAARADHSRAEAALDLSARRSFYTLARGSSDAVASILAYEMMRELGVPVTSLPPSVFSIGAGVAMDGAALLTISQSGASDDLVRAVAGVRDRGGVALAITNQPGSRVEAAADLTLPLGAGPELAVPATKTVIGSVAAGLALLAAIKPSCRASVDRAAEAFAGIDGASHPMAATIRSAFLRSSHVYVIGRDAGLGAAQEVALKIKETCAIHAEAFSSSEVLHGPVQLATRPLTVLMLDTGQEAARESLELAEARFRKTPATVLRIRPEDMGVSGLTPAAAAAILLYLVYPVILSTAIALGHDPDRPATLAKVTATT